jgi:hypothetical protein
MHAHLFSFSAYLLISRRDHGIMPPLAHSWR